jgi:scyllo-inositol 2-dehydrogenase (NADP+)
MENGILGGAVIGYGGMGNFHAKKMQSVDGIEIIGVYDIDPARHEIAKERGINYYNSREELLADSRIDLVVVATPNDVHKEIVIDSLRAGKNVLCEKPVTMKSEDLEDMIAVSKETGKLFTVHQNRRWDEDYLIAKRIFEKKTVGNVFRFESKVHGSHGIPEGWRGEKAHGGGMLLDWGVHLLDQMLTMMSPRKLLSVYASLTNITNDECDDGFYATFKFEGGIEWLVEVVTNNFIEMPRWYILGENGSAVIKNWDCDGEVVKVINWEKYDVVPVPAGAGLTKTMAPRNSDTVKSVTLERVEVDQKTFYKNLIAAINGKEPIEVTHEQLRLSVKLIETIFKSAEQNTVIKF